MNRQFRLPAPKLLWFSDFNYVAILKGFIYVAFVSNAYAHRIAEWGVSRALHAEFVIDVLEQADHERRPNEGMGLLHHSDQKSQYKSVSGFRTAPSVPRPDCLIGGMLSLGVV